MPRRTAGIRDLPDCFLIINVLGGEFHIGELVAAQNYVLRDNLFMRNLFKPAPSYSACSCLPINTPLVSETRCSRGKLCLPTGTIASPEAWFPSGNWYLQTNIWVLGVLIIMGMSLHLCTAGDR